jgi:hypothetical protein
MCCQGGNKARLHYSRMEKQSQMFPVLKRVAYICEAAFLGYFLFSSFNRVMDTEKYFSSTEEGTVTIVMISGK